MVVGQVFGKILWSESWSIVRDISLGDNIAVTTNLLKLCLAHKVSTYLLSSLPLLYPEKSLVLLMKWSTDTSTPVIRLLSHSTLTLSFITVIVFLGAMRATFFPKKHAVHLGGWVISLAVVWRALVQDVWLKITNLSKWEMTKSIVPSK